MAINTISMGRIMVMITATTIIRITTMVMARKRIATMTIRVRTMGMDTKHMAMTTIKVTITAIMVMITAPMIMATAMATIIPTAPSPRNCACRVRTG